MRYSRRIVLSLVMLLAVSGLSMCVALGQEQDPEAPPVASPVESAPAPPAESAPTPPAESTPTPPAESTPTLPASVGADGLRFNFQDVPLDTVLNYLSESAGFIIVREAQVDGRVDVVSHQPLSKDEAVDLLNTVLNEKGLAAVRNERTLTIVKREEAGKRNIPVRMGSNPESIPKTDEMVTQIIPIRYADATQLLETLTPLLPSYAVATANKSSNAIVLTDTQTSIRRMAEIVRALDTSISDISEVKVYSLLHSKAADVAKLITSLFDTSTTTNQNNQGGNPFRQFFGRGRGGDGPGGGDAQQNNNQDSAARQAAMRVQAVADERTNSLVVSAPSDMISLIDTLIDEIDKVSPPATEIRVFPLKHADSEEMATVINTTFETTSTTSTNQQQGRRFFGGGPGMPPGFPGGGGQQNNQSSQSANVVKAVSDYRTNSVVVTAETSLMEQIAAMIEKLDSDPSKQQKVFVYKLQNADAETVAQIVQGLISEDVSSQSTTSTRRTTTQTRTSTNASTNRNTSSSRNTGSSSRTRN